MKIVHVVSMFSPEHGGPTYAISNYCRAQVDHGDDVSVVTMEGYPGTSPAVRLPLPITQTILPVGWPSKLGRCPEMATTLLDLARPDLYHVHGSWHLALSDAVMVAKKQGVPVVLELMGSYSKYELGRKSARKWLARLLYQDKTIRSVDCLHANSHEEARFMRELGFKVPIAVVPVGVALCRSMSLSGAESECPLPTDWAGRRWMLYLARVHPTKGIDMLLEAWARAMAGNGEWRLLIAGHGEREFVDSLKGQVERLSINESCHFSGGLSSVQKEWAYANADAYLLPSRQENFGNTVPEALAHGCPVGTTTGTPWRLLEQEGCGWVSEPTVEGITETLIRIGGTTADERKEMGERGRRMVAARFSINVVYDSIRRIYEWVRGGSCPEDILYR